MRVLAPATWRAFGAFLRRPSLPDRADGVSRAGLLDIARLFPLDLLVMALLIGGFGVLTALGLKMPAHALEGLKIGPGLALLIVLGAPIAEETIFRGWLSGRPGHVLAWLAVLAGGLIAGFAALDLPQPTRAHVILGVMAA
ncbi:MAG: CPBP family glutamic-type intramembrane protease, partial [Tsuneonella sp.]